MFKDLLKQERLPHGWCPGCGLGHIMGRLAEVMDELGLNSANTVLVSGVGCTGRMPSYFRLDGVYTLHGRTLPVAEAIHAVNPALNVIVVSGDGDLVGIGGNHLLHVSRRNPKLTVLCNNNEVYGLTGGQMGPTTPKGAVTLSSPAGNPHNPVDIQALLKAAGQYFYARTTVYHQAHLRDCIKQALAWPGFAFVDIVSQCIENNGRRLGFGSAYEMLRWYREHYKRAPEGAETLGPFELGVVKKG